MTLDDAEYQLYRQIYEHVKPQAPVPDLVIYLQASVNTLVAAREEARQPDRERHGRGLPAPLSEAYTRYFYDYSTRPLLIVNSEKLNFVDSSEHLDMLIERIEGMRGAREFFNRA
jgi:deoxyadenosine/deoxycytidine kinase